LDETGIDHGAYAHLVRRLAQAGVDSIGALGSTGSYAYLDRKERQSVLRVAIENAGTVPVLAGIGALRTRDVLLFAEDAQKIGASALLLAPVSYQKLTADEVFGLFQTVSRHVSVPLCVYDNPSTTHFDFSDELHGRIAALPNIRSIKIPPVPLKLDEARDRLAGLRSKVRSDVAIGVSGDSTAAVGMLAGCEVWYSVLGGLFPRTCLALTRDARAGDIQGAMAMTLRLEPIWGLFRRFGSLRVVAAASGLLGLTQGTGLPLPLNSLPEDGRSELAQILKNLGPLD
jgi:4-hydroxy-tetrahydrodipicolinate synthase